RRRRRRAPRRDRDPARHRDPGCVPGGGAGRGPPRAGLGHRARPARARLHELVALQELGLVARPGRPDRAAHGGHLASESRAPLAEAQPRRARAPGRGPGAGGVVISARKSERPLALVRRAVGGAGDVRGKLARLGRILAGYLDGAELDARLRQLHAAGIIEAIPTRIQILVGGIDMLRFWITPAAADYYRKQGLDFGFHQLLRGLEEPASIADPGGFFSTRDGIIGHLMQVVHANPVYDLELLGMFPDGHDELQRQLEEMVAATHPRARAIGAIVEEPEYHGRLLEFVRSWRRDPTISPLLRGNVAASPLFGEMAKIFGTLRSAARYFCTLPTTPVAALAHLRSVRLPDVCPAAGR